MSPLPVPIEDSYLGIALSLKTGFPGFSASREYALIDDCDDLPGVILAAFARYLIACLKEGGVAAELPRGIAAINTLYESQDYRIRASICQEFIEAFDGAPAAVEFALPLLSKPLAEAFARVLR